MRWRRLAALTSGRASAQLRRLLYCGEWIESHVLHVAMLHAPDFLGYESALHMAKDHPEARHARAFALKKAGNEIVTAVGGREIHPVNVRVGGFYRAPSAAELAPLVPRARKGARRGGRAPALGLGLRLPRPRPPTTSSSRSGTRLEYPMNEGRIVSSEGLDIPAADYEKHFEEEHVQRSNALHSPAQGRRHHPGRSARPLQPELRPPARADPGRREGSGARDRRAGIPSEASSSAAIETLYAVDEALRILAIVRAPRAVLRRGGAARRDGSRRHRGAARAPLPSLPDRRGRAHPRTRGSSRPTAQNLRAIEADLGAIRARPTSTSPQERLTLAVRAGRPQPRPVHLLRHALP